MGSGLGCAGELEIRKWLDEATVLSRERRHTIVALLYAGNRIVPPCSPYVLASSLHVHIAPIRGASPQHAALMAFMEIAWLALPVEARGSWPDVARLGIELAVPPCLAQVHGPHDLAKIQPCVPAWAAHAAASRNGTSGIRAKVG